MLSSPLPVPNKCGFLPDGCFCDLFFKMLSDGKFLTFLNSLFQGIFSVNALIILTVKTCVLQSVEGEIQKPALSS